MSFPKSKHFQKHASTLFVKYNSSPFVLLKSAYPDFNWEPWRFTKSVANWHSDTKLMKKFMESAGQQLGVKEMADWYKITQKVFKLKRKILNLKGFDGCERSF